MSKEIDQFQRKLQNYVSERFETPQIWSIKVNTYHPKNYIFNELSLMAMQREILIWTYWFLGQCLLPKPLPWPSHRLAGNTYHKKYVPILLIFNKIMHKNNSMIFWTKLIEWCIKPLKKYFYYWPILIFRPNLPNANAYHCGFL